MEKNVVEFMVGIKSATGQWQGLGSHAFAVPPRTGEYVTLNDENDKAQAYRVKAVLHPLDPASTAGELVLEYVGTDLDLRKTLFGSTSS